MNAGEIIIHNHAYSLDFLRTLVADLSEVQMVGQTDDIKNHAAWVIGHLTISCQSIGGEIGMERWLDADWGKRFGMGSTPVSDVGAYPSKTESLHILADAQIRLANVVRCLPPEQLLRPLPDENYHDDLPTTQHALSQILVAHTAYHVGQTVIWRRAIGLPKVQRSFL